MGGDQFATDKAETDSPRIQKEVDSTSIQGEGDPNRIQR